MKLEVGQFVRTDDGEIYIVHELVYGKNGEVSATLTWKDSQKKIGRCTLVNIENITKASHNIIDLIEEGDYVNGCLVVEHAYEKGRLFVSNVYIGGKTITTHEDYSWELTKDREKDIKIILTHEVFEREAYRI